MLGVGAVSGHAHTPAAASGSESRPALKLAHVLRAAKGHLAEPRYSPQTQSVLQTLKRCQSSELGYHVLDCDSCPHQVFVPRGCGSRHCPSCGHQRAEDWVAARKLELLDCRYHQVVFTLPPMFYPLVKENPVLLYRLLLDTVRDVLDQLARDPKHLGGVPQFLLALHTWNGALDFHVHVHALMAAGAYNPKTDTWIPSKNKDFLFHVDVLSALFRGKFIAGLKKLEAAGRLAMSWPINEETANPVGWSLFLEKAYRTRFFTYVDKTAAGPANVIEYLGHYLHQTGLSNARLVSLHGDQVTYRCKDRKKRHSSTGSYTRTVPIDEFVRLFAQHILPKGFHRIRFCGLWSQVNKKRYLADARAAVLRQRHQRPPDAPIHRPGPPPKPRQRCPACHVGLLVLGCTVVHTNQGSILIPHLQPRPPPDDLPGSLT